MKRRLFNLIIVSALFLSSLTVFAAEPVSIRVACVGDSITYGAGINDRVNNSYPAQLAGMLGEYSTVENFGVNAATLLKKGNKPYWNLNAYKNALAFKPDAVVIKLGTNDSKPGNWKHKAEYVGDYVELVQSFQKLDSKPTVWICYPVPAYPGQWGITDKVMKEEVMPLIDVVAKKTNVKIIDLYTALSGKKELFPDTVHPNAAGAKIIAETVCKAITGKTGTDKSPTLSVNPKDISIESDLGTFKAVWDVEYPEAGVMLATLTLESDKGAAPPAFDIKWDIPTVDIDSVWVSDYSKEKLDFGGTRIESRAVQRAPLITYISQADQNRFTVAFSDCLRPITIRGGVKEEDGRMYFTASLFKEKHPVLEKYQVTLRFDSRSKPYYKVLKDTAKWWAAQDNYTPAPVPEAVRVPVYSTWYNYHQSVDPDRIVEDCRIGGELGLEGVIVDDGWQTLDSNRGYAYTGDWKPERIPDMKGFVDRIHALDQKIWLWYSVPMAGIKSEAIKKFEGKTLKFSSGLQAHVLDPRYPEVREYLIGIYENAVRDWGLDGLKLDFIGMFAPDGKTVLTAEDGRDYASVDKAVDRLLTDVMARLRNIKPDIAIEFRQPYNGPLMRKYGNAFRAVDCPYTAAVNRKLTVDVRLLCDNTTVHSDPIIWHPDEPVETAALQILNILFAVPQISVRLSEVSQDHRDMIGFWMNYCKTNRDVLLDGEFMPVSPGQNYPMVSARTDDKLIAALYQDMIVKPGSDAPAKIDVVNGQSNSDGVVVLFSKDFGNARIRIFDTRGKVVSETVEAIGAGAKAWKVPPAGLLEIRKVNNEK
ncbi:MAG: alpha-galactosidase [Phycisphaerae bacterium]|nr:alpha-galactosidase [Phycisphaerae bacterium]